VDVDPLSRRIPWFLSPREWTEALSQPEHSIAFEHDVGIHLRDGTRLSADVWRPASPGRFPVIFVYTPYDNSYEDLIDRARFFVPRGYVVATVDARGRYDSDGVSYLYWNIDWRAGRFDGEDVDDCLTWLGSQRWSSGRVGMTGGSYLAFVQWLAAPLGNRHLAALIPYGSPDDHYDNVFPSGALQLSNALAMLAGLGATSRHTNDQLRGHWWDYQQLYRHLPLRTLDEAMFGRANQFWQDLVTHPSRDDYWRFSVGSRPRPGHAAVGRYARVRVPSLNVTGWYDLVSQATINNFVGMMTRGPRNLRRTHQLIVGPWTHVGAQLGLRTAGEIDFGESAEVDFRWVELRWFDRWLKGIANGVDVEPQVSIFTMGTDEWRSESSWPPPQTSTVELFLRSGGRASGVDGDGRLSRQPPGSDEPPDRYVFDPADPVPSVGGTVSMVPAADGPRDQSPLQHRSDILVYTSDRLSHDLAVAGRVTVHVYASTTALDTDFTAKLVDRRPDGRAWIILEGIIRGRYRRSFKRPRLLRPGRPYTFVIDLWSTSHVFRAGHQIQLEVSSSNFPKYDRNPNTGSSFAEDARLVPATQTVYHDARRASRLRLPVRGMDASDGSSGQGAASRPYDGDSMNDR
jgi:putative CocE/NonD family hydrolase